MCQRGYGSSVLELSKPIKCKTKPKAEFLQSSGQCLKGSDHLRAVVKFFLLVFYFAEKIIIENCRKIVSIPGIHSRKTQQRCPTS